MYGKQSLKKNNKWVGDFQLDESIEKIKTRRTKREIKKISQSSHYNLLTPNSGISPMGNIAKMLMKTVLKSKNKSKATR